MPTVENLRGRRPSRRLLLAGIAAGVAVAAVTVYAARTGYAAPSATSCGAPSASALTSSARPVPASATVAAPKAPAPSLAPGGTPDTSPWPPGSPTGVAASAVSATVVRVTWTASVPGSAPIAGYDVSYRPASALYWQVTSVGTVNEAIVTGLQPNMQYQIRVAARDTLGHASAYTSGSQVSVKTQPANVPPDTIPPSPPTNLTATDIGPTSARLTWSPSKDNAIVTGYEVIGGVGGCALMLYTIVNTTTVVVTFSPPSSGTATAVFYVQARDPSGNRSPVSNRVTFEVSGPRQ